MILETVVVGAMEVNCYILAGTSGLSAVIIDPGSQPQKIRQALDKHKLKPAFIINTHGHYDHIGADDAFGVPVYIHKEDLSMLKEPDLNLSSAFSLGYSVKSEIRLLKENEIIELDDLQLKALHLPGHTPGGVALLINKPTDKIAFTGDSLFCEGIGRTDFPGGNTDLLIKSVKDKLLVLDDDTIVYPGHGPSSTIGHEKRFNPFLA